MSKCKEAYEFCFGVTWDEGSPHCNDWQAAWNARGKVDAEICRAVGNPYQSQSTEESVWTTATANHCANAIEQENQE